MKKSIIIIITSLLIALGIGYYMFDLSSQEKLWGHLPLFFFLSIWVAWLVAWESRVVQHPKRLQLLLAAVGSGVLLGVGFPPLPLVLTLCVGFVPLLWAEKQLYENGNKGIEVFRLAFIAFGTWNILTTFWVSNASFPSGVIAILANSILMSLPILGLHKARQWFNEKLIYWAFIAYWLTFEHFHLNWDLSWPWLTLGNGLAYFPSLMQWYEFTGVMGGSAWILVVNVVFFQAFEYRNSVHFKWKLIRPLFILLVPIICSVWIFNTIDLTPSETTIDVVVVQPNYEPHYGKNKVHQNLQLKNILTQADKKITKNTDYIVLPETTFEGINFDDKSNITMLKIKRFLKDLPKAKLITGLGGYKMIADGKETPNTRTFTRNDGSVLKYEAYNAAKQIKTDTIDYGFYTKAKLVPGAESMPYPQVLGLLKPVFALFGGTTAGLGQTDEIVLFENKDNPYKIGTVICYEQEYGDYVREHALKGANALFVITNDGWWDNTAGHRQHLHFASIRAIETRLPIARSANTGISCFIDKAGNITQATTYETDAVIQRKMNIEPTAAPTFYVRNGNFIARFAMFFAVGFILMSLVRKFAKR